MIWRPLENPEGRRLNEAIYEHIRRAICRGALRGRLPSKNRAAAAFEVSKVTIEKAYEQLKAEGYIYARERSGYFVELDSALAADADKRVKRAGGARSSLVAVAAPAAAAPAAAGSKTGEDKAAAPRYDLNTYAVPEDSFPFAVWSRLMRRVLVEEEQGIVGATPGKGLASLREAIVEHLRKYRRINVAAEQVIVGAGSEWIWSLLVQLLGTGRRYAIENPGYAKVAKILDAYGIRVSRIGMRSDGIDLQALRAANAEVLHLTPSHHFPLGIIMPIQQRLELLALAQDSGMVIIEDDYDSEFRFAGRPIPALAGLDGHDRVIYVNTFAKTLAPSLRISYMVLPPPLLARYERELSFYACTVPGFEQQVMARFLQEGHFSRHFNRMKAVYKARHDALIDALEQSELGKDVVIEGKAVGLHIVLTLKRDLSEEQMQQRAEAAGVALRGLSTFCNGPCAITPKTVVMGFAALEADAAGEMVKCLEKAWR